LKVHEPAPLEAATKLPYYAWLVVAATCIGAFMAQLDASIVQLALPTLRRQFHATLPAISWIAIAYPLAYASTLPAFARLSKVFGRKLLYVAGFAVFGISSTLCGATSSLPLLIAFRLLQGAGGGLLGANSMALLQQCVPTGKRGRAIGFFATAQAVGISAGPLIGGLLLAAFGWRWVFWVSAPVGFLGAVFAWFVMPQTKSLVHYKHFDWRGVLLLALALILIIVLLSEIHALGLESAALMGGAFTVVALLASFMWLERRDADPLIDLRIFKLRAFSGGVIGVNLSYALLYSMLFLMSFAFVRGLEESPIVAGIHLSVLPIALGLAAPLSGGLYERVGKRVMTTAGMALCLGAILLLFMALSNAGEVFLRMVALGFFGAGVGMFIATNSSATMASVPSDQAGEAGGLVNLMRSLGCAVGVAVASTALTWRMHVLSGVRGTAEGSAHSVLTAVSHVLWVPGIFAIIAAMAALMRNRAQPEAVAAPATLVPVTETKG
jgi:EmrB/QacA subfamily drug resistance transporter